MLATEARGLRLEAIVTVYDRAGAEIARREAIDGPVDLTLTIPGWCAGFEVEPESIIVMVSSVGQRPPDDLFYPIPDGPTVVPDFGGVGSTGAYRLTVRTGSTEPALVAEPNDTIPTAVATGLVNDGVYVGESYMGDTGITDRFVATLEPTSIPTVSAADLMSIQSEHRRCYWARRLVVASQWGVAASDS